jgi:cephalosporin hydroxylase
MEFPHFKTAHLEEGPDIKLVPGGIQRGLRPVRLDANRGVDMDISCARYLKLPGLHLIEGKCQDENVFQKVCSLARKKKRPMVIGDCDDSKDHVLGELRRSSLWSRWVAVTSLKMVFATLWAGAP